MRWCGVVRYEAVGRSREQGAGSRGQGARSRQAKQGLVRTDESGVGDEQPTNQSPPGFSGLFSFYIVILSDCHTQPRGTYPAHRIPWWSQVPFFLLRRKRAIFRHGSFHPVVVAVANAFGSGHPRLPRAGCCLAGCLDGAASAWTSGQCCPWRCPAAAAVLPLASRACADGGGGGPAEEGEGEGGGEGGGGCCTGGRNVQLGAAASHPSCGKVAEEGWDGCC